MFALNGTPIGSRVDSTVTVLDASGATVASNDDGTWQMRDSLLVHTFAKDGRYALRVADALDAGGPRDFHYRLTAGELPYVTIVFPLGGARDRLTRFAIEGVHSVPAHGGFSTHRQAELRRPLVVCASRRSF